MANGEDWKMGTFLFFRDLCQEKQKRPHFPPPLDRAKPGYEASRLAGPASGRRKEYPERSRADP